MTPTYDIELPLHACYSMIQDAIYALERGDSLVIRSKYGKTTLSYLGGAVATRGRPLPQPLRDAVEVFNESERRRRFAPFVRLRPSALAR